MRRFLIVGLLCIAFAEAGPGKFVAVLETALNDKGALSHSEQMFLTDELRSQAVKALPAEMGFTIMTRENIQSMLPPDKSLESCSGTSCLVDIGRNIAADYVAQGRVGRFGKDLTLTVELYETQGAKLVGSFTAKNANADGLLSGIGKDAPGLFGRIRGSGWLPASVQSVSGVAVPAFADEVGTVVTVAFTDGPGAVLIDGKMACTYKDKCAKELTKGEHQVALSRDGYRDSTFVIGVPKGSNRYVVALVSKSGVLTIRAQDGKSGDAVVADVIVDGRTVGQTPWSGPVAMTAKSVGLRAEGYEDAYVSDRAEEGRKKAVTVSMVAKSVSDGMVQIPAGCFQMGSDDGGEDEKPVHRVCVSAFQMDKYEVTQGAYRRATGKNPSQFSSCGDNCPVEQVSWDEAKSYCANQGKRLPTEAEWEYAARGGMQSRGYTYAGSNDPNEVGWFYDNSGDSRLNSDSWDVEKLTPNKNRTHPVGKKTPNELGLYDMSGNVYEWVSDWYGKDYYADSPQQDPRGPTSGSSRVIRGGSWNIDPFILRSALRLFNDPVSRIDILGFRCVSR